jgi:hypothetical protein
MPGVFVRCEYSNPGCLAMVMLRCIVLLGTIASKSASISSNPKLIYMQKMGKNTFLYPSFENAGLV